MIKEIQYNGYSANPSDYECKEGDLALSVGLVPEDGAMQPVMPPAEVFQLEHGSRVMYIHKSSNYKHYIVVNDKTVSWFTGAPHVTPNPTVLRTFNEIYQITSIGNTLIVLADDGMHYFLWKGENGSYKYLGTKMPECPISFGLQGEVVIDDKYLFNVKLVHDYAPSEGFSEFDEDEKKNITDKVLPFVNKFIADESVNKGRFIYPFFVRYAYRLYDGTLAMHSSPVLMVATTGLAPQAAVVRGWGSEGELIWRNVFVNVLGVCHKLDYSVLNRSAINNLKEWGDIISSVDIFISKPIYTYDQNGECTQFSNSVIGDGLFSICKHTNQKVSEFTYPVRYQKRYFEDLVSFTLSDSTSELSKPGVAYIKLPERSHESVRNDICSVSQFYLLKSIKLDNLQTERTVIPVEGEYLKSILAREVMTDDYDSHDKLIPKYAFPYNSRLNVTNIRKELYADYNPISMLSYTDGYIGGIAYNEEKATHDYLRDTKIYFVIKQNGKEAIMGGYTCEVSGYYGSFHYLYYPNIHATKAIIVQTSANGMVQDKYELPLEQHKFLNGAYYFSPDYPISSSISEPVESSLYGRTIELPNKIYTSEVNNPFMFPVLGINTVGTGEIMAISSAVQALSEGQFGQFPLYAFTTEGVWALEVSSTGTYSAKQPVTREVCTSPESIVQIDKSVLFATNRGIMMLSGAHVECLSRSLESVHPFSLEQIPNSDVIINAYNANVQSVEDNVTSQDIKVLPFFDFIEDCRMLFDYTHQHIIVYNKRVAYAYVFSLKSRMWGMMMSDIENSVNSYPEALAMDGYSRLVDFSKTDADKISAMLVTRPFKLDQINILKTIDTIIQRGRMDKGHVSQILYGTRDLVNWQTVQSSVDIRLCGISGTPYKAFRLALICALDSDESIYGCTVVFENRMTNRIR